MLISNLQVILKTTKMINQPPFLRNEPLISLVQGVLDEECLVSL